MYKPCTLRISVGGRQEGRGVLIITPEAHARSLARSWRSAFQFQDEQSWKSYIKGVMFTEISRASRLGWCTDVASMPDTCCCRVYHALTSSCRSYWMIYLAHETNAVADPLTLVSGTWGRARPGVECSVRCRLGRQVFWQGQQYITGV